MKNYNTIIRDAIISLGLVILGIIAVLSAPSNTEYILPKSLAIPGYIVGIGVIVMGFTLYYSVKFRQSASAAEESKYSQLSVIGSLTVVFLALLAALMYVFLNI